MKELIINMLKSRKTMFFCAQFILGLTVIISSILFGELFFPVSVVAQTRMIREQHRLISANCPPVADPTASSLLVVILDRSGSLTVQPGATDPQLYSTSVTKALADLWPGQMAVIPFSGNTKPNTVFGPATLTDTTQRTSLKNAVEQTNSNIGGDTPLAPAMQKALTLLNNASPGSRAVVITDGNPTGAGNNDGAHQEQNIRQNLLPKFCQQGIAVSAFGLTINVNTTDGQDANRLLTDIANTTNGTYKNVTSPEDLARAVMQLYADWQHLIFKQIAKQGDSFPVAINTFAHQVTIVTFRSGSNYQVVVDAPDNQPVQGVQPLTDRHYEIDSLSGVFVSGTYTVHTSGDPDAQVYALVNSPYQIHVLAPTAATLPYGTPIEIDASWYNGDSVLTPVQGQATIVAHVSFIVNGRQSGATNDIILTQQGSLFKGQTQAYKHVGQVVIEVDGSYQGIQRTAKTSLQLVKPPPTPFHCHKSALRCFWDAYSLQIIIFVPLFLLLLILLIWWLLWLRQPAPYGWLSDGRFTVEISHKYRRLSRRIFSKSVVSSNELLLHPGTRGGGFKFNTAIFDLAFKRDGSVYLRPSVNDRSRISVNRQTPNAQKREMVLPGSGTITIDRKDVATYTIIKPRGYDPQGKII
jgi:von Willebrand factor type A domain